MSDAGAIIGKLHKHKDTFVDREIGHIITVLQKQQISLERAQDPQVLARAIARHFPSDVLLNIERYFRGERDGKRFHLRNDKDLPTIEILKLAGSTANVIQTDAGSPGAHLSAGGSWNNACTRKLKHHFKKVDADEILSRLMALKVREWEYRQCAEGRHVGPTAEDFYHAFCYGNSPNVLNTVDLASVALLAVQSLSRRVTKLERKLARLTKKKVK